MLGGRVWVRLEVMLRGPIWFGLVVMFKRAHLVWVCSYIKRDCLIKVSGSRWEGAFGSGWWSY